jgi:tetrahydromethanopterin S-methyltransferase subunit G
MGQYSPEINLMPSDVTREEFEGRVGVLEREVEGEKMVTRHILEQTRHNSDDLAAIKTRLDRVELKVDAVAEDVHGVRHDLTGLRGMVAGLTTSLPTMIGDVMRQVLRERGGKS